MHWRPWSINSHQKAAASISSSILTSPLSALFRFMCKEEMERMPSSYSGGETPDGGLICPQETPERTMNTIMSFPCLPITLEFTDVSYSVKFESRSRANGGRMGRMFCPEQGDHGALMQERTVLSGVSGVASTGEFLAILGPSGSGKSTLLNVLAGRLQGKYTGTVLANGRKLTKQVLRRTGFVTQDDLLYPHLTVKETLVFCALLRLPKTLTKKEKVRVAESVIFELGLCKCEDTIIGNAYIRGVSGGERKRVSIGHEVLVNPSLLLLDEPTSGLDSTAAYRLVSRLGGLAKKGKTIVASMHQPSSRVYQMFHSVLLLSEGNCLYFGKGSDAMDYFSSIGLSPRFPVNPADFMLDLANGVAQVEGQLEMEKSIVKQSLVSSFNLLLAPKLKAGAEQKTAAEEAISIIAGSQKPVGKEQKSYSSISWFNQFTILLHRSLKERRHEAFNSLRVFQVVAAAILAGLMWWHSSIHNVHDRLGLLFFISIFWGVFSSFNAVFTFPQERAIFIKERSSRMYTLSSYFIARMAGDLPMELVLPTLFLTITYWMAGLRPELGAFMITLAVLLGYVLVAQGLGLAVGAAIMDAKQASTIVTVTMLAFLLTGGYYVHNVPACMVWMRYTSFTFYCYRLLIAVQYEGREMVSLPDLSHSHDSSDGLLDQNVTTVMSIVVMAFMFVGYRLLAYMALRRIKV